MKGLEAKTLGLKKVIRHEYKRIVAFMLTVAMVVTNFGTNLTVAFAAGEETSSLFLLDSSELEDAIRKQGRKGISARCRYRQQLCDRAYRSAGILQRRYRRCGIPVHQ